MIVFKPLTIVLAFVLAAPIQAATVVFNAAGIDNVEWLDLTVTAGKSRLEVESLLAGGEVLDGWRYASRSEVEALYDFLWGGTTEGYSEDNFGGARSFFDSFGVHSTFGPEGYDEYGASSWYTLFGNQYECSASADESCLGVVAIYDMDYGASINVGYFHDDHGLSTGADAINDQESISSLYGYPYLGSHLVREVAAVPVPAAFWLFTSGVVALSGIMRRRTDSR